MRTLATCAAFVVVAALLAACNPTLIAQSLPPPGRIARLDPIHGFWGTKAYRVEVSHGVAIAITCHDGGPCRNLAVRSDDPQIATARPASLAQLQPTAYLHQVAPATAFVIVGKAPGTTRIRLTSAGGHRDIYVTVVAPPEHAAPATAAR